VRFHIDSGVQQVQVPLSQLHGVDSIVDGHGSPLPVQQMFEKAAQREERESAYVVTGNLIAGLAELGRGRVISFTDKQGKIRQGVILPRTWKPSEMKGDQLLRQPDAVLDFLFENIHNRDVARFGVADRGNQVRITPLPDAQGIEISVPKSKKAGGRFFLNRSLTDLTGDFVSVGQRMRAEVHGRDQSKAAIEILKQEVALYAPESLASLAGTYAERYAPQPTDGLASLAEEGETRRGVPVGELRRLVNERRRTWEGMPRTRVVHRPQDLPAHLMDQFRRQGVLERVEGVFDPTTNNVYLVAANLDSTAHAERVLLEEVVGHYGLRQTFGEALTPLLNQVALAYGRTGLREEQRRHGRADPGGGREGAPGRPPPNRRGWCGRRVSGPRLRRSRKVRRR
jgi:hypothetical protein